MRSPLRTELWFSFATATLAIAVPSGQACADYVQCKQLEITHLCSNQRTLVEDRRFETTHFFAGTCTDACDQRAQIQMQLKTHSEGATGSLSWSDPTLEGSLYDKSVGFWSEIDQVKLMTSQEDSEEDQLLGKLAAIEAEAKTLKQLVGKGPQSAAHQAFTLNLLLRTAEDRIFVDNPSLRNSLRSGLDHFHYLARDPLVIATLDPIEIEDSVIFLNSYNSVLREILARMAAPKDVVEYKFMKDWTVVVGQSFIDQVLFYFPKLLKTHQELNRIRKQLARRSETQPSCIRPGDTVSALEETETGYIDRYEKIGDPLLMGERELVRLHATKRMEAVRNLTPDIDLELDETRPFVLSELIPQVKAWNTEMKGCGKADAESGNSTFVEYSPEQPAPTQKPFTWPDMIAKNGKIWAELKAPAGGILLEIEVFQNHPIIKAVEGEFSKGIPVAEARRQLEAAIGETYFTFQRRDCAYISEVGKVPVRVVRRGSSVVLDLQPPSCSTSSKATAQKPASPQR